MPDEEITQTTQEDGTGDQTPSEVTGDQTAAENQSAPPPVDYEKKFAASTAENQRIMAEQQRIAAENVQLRSILAQTQPQPQQPQQDSGDFNYFRDALLDNDQQGLKRFVSDVARQSAQLTRDELMTQQQRQTSIGQATDLLKDPTSPEAAATLQRYREIVMDPQYGYIRNDTVPIQTVNGPVQINPHKLRQAALEVKAGLHDRTKNLERSAASSAESFIEPTEKAKPPEPSSFDPNKHLSEHERGAVNDLYGGDAKRYWNRLPKKVQEERLKLGRSTFKPRGES